VAVALVLASKAVAKGSQSCFGEQSVQVIYNDVARVAVWICMHPCALPGCELRFVMVTRWHFTGYPVTKLERFRMQRLFFPSWRLSRCPVCLCSLRCIVQTHRIQLTAFACHHTTVGRRVSRLCAGSKWIVFASTSLSACAAIHLSKT
jgi:hypothetical protein